jgi:hypothetical protein
MAHPAWIGRESGDAAWGWTARARLRQTTKDEVRSTVLDSVSKGLLDLLHGR